MREWQRWDIIEIYDNFSWRLERHERAVRDCSVALQRQDYEEAVRGRGRNIERAGVPEDMIDVAWVPGAFEIPLAADKMASSRRYSAVLCLGVVIRGDTTHDQHINRAVSMGIMEVNMKYGVPVLFGVLTCDTVEQAVQAQAAKVLKVP